MPSNLLTLVRERMVDKNVPTPLTLASFIGLNGPELTQFMNEGGVPSPDVLVRLRDGLEIPDEDFKNAIEVTMGELHEAYELEKESMPDVITITYKSLPPKCG